MEQLLYHYTDYTALDGILNKRELRVNNVLNMNDAKEMELFVSGIFSAVKKRFMQIQDDKMVKKLNEMQKVAQNHYFDYSAYAACFSEYRDDAAQWERYANRGKGVCLCFRKSMLEKIACGAISLRKVIYQSNMDDHPLVGRLFSILHDNTKLEFTSDQKKIALEAWINSASYKHPSFSSEHEIRLIVMPFEAAGFNLKPEYHVAKDRIKKYYPLNLDQMCSEANITIEDLITEIIVGPESTQALPILRDYLKDIGLKVLSGHISTSDCPLRSKF